MIRIAGRIGKFISKFIAVSRVSTAWSWFGTALEPFTGAWQKNIELDKEETLVRNSAVYACITGISTDISKMRIKLCENQQGIWIEKTTDSPFLPVLRKPNHYQNRMRFVEQWIIAKLCYGNAYILKERDERRMVKALYPLHPRRVTPLVANDGGVYYQLNQDYLSGVDETSIIVPASEIIHDMMPALWHPLIGVPPLYACALSGTLGGKIQNASTYFFQNRSLPGGILTAPGHISDETADRLKKDFETRYSGEFIGRLFVAGDGLEFKPMQMSAEASQLAEQFKLTVEDIARAFHYPLFKLGGPLPAYAGNVEALITTYYTDCLQSLIESLEISLDEGLKLPNGYGTELDLDNLMRMDTAALFKTNNAGVRGGWMMPDEARFKANMKPVAGGNSPYLQQQNFSLAALAKRDAKEDPFAKSQPKSAGESKTWDKDDLEIILRDGLRKELMPS